jgi:hypothetical protein
MEQRKSSRIKKKLIGKINQKQCLIENFSENGMCVKVLAVNCPECKDLDIEVSVNQKTLNLNGKICWNRRDKYRIHSICHLEVRKLLFISFSVLCTFSFLLNIIINSIISVKKSG